MMKKTVQQTIAALDIGSVQAQGKSEASRAVDQARGRADGAFTQAQTDAMIARYNADNAKNQADRTGN